MRPLAPGVRCLTLRHPLGSPEWANQLCTCTTAPFLSNLLANDGTVIPGILTCKIKFDRPELQSNAQDKAAWPASHLLPLPDGDDLRAFRTEKYRDLPSERASTKEKAGW